MRRGQSPSARLRRTWLLIATGVSNQLVLGSIAAMFVLFCSGLAFWVAEKDTNANIRGIGSGLKWVSLTLLSQSTPWEITTRPGDLIYYIVLIVGVSLVAMATGAIASKLVEYVIRKGSGMGRAKQSNHVVICGWSSQGNEILRELHADEVEDKRPVVILADLDHNPTNDPLVTFVRGNTSDSEDLLRAGIDRASTAIILADSTKPDVSADDRDAKTLLTTLAVESVNPQCYTCVEVIRSENRQHFERTHADELVVSAELTGALLASSAITHGLSQVVSDLITHPKGNEFYALTAPKSVEGKTFCEVMFDLKTQHDAVLVAVGRETGEYELNPPAASKVRPGDLLLVISAREVGSLGKFGPATR